MEQTVRVEFGLLVERDRDGLGGSAEIGNANSSRKVRIAHYSGRDYFIPYGQQAGRFGEETSAELPKCKTRLVLEVASDDRYRVIRWAICPETNLSQSGPAKRLRFHRPLPVQREGPVSSRSRV